MTDVDYAVLIVYFMAVVFLGGYVSRNQKGLEDYFAAGRSTPWWLVVLTVTGTTTSAISLISFPAQSYRSNLTVNQLYIAGPLAALFVCAFLIPFFYNFKLYSIYEYLERRFDLKTRLLASASFLILKGLVLGVVLFAAAIVLSAMTHLSTAAAIIVVGIVTTGYTLAGGMKAVIWTDALQVTIFTVGPVIALIICVLKVHGGFPEIFAIAAQHGKLKFLDFSLNPTHQFTFWSGLIGMFFYLVGVWGVDQTQVQKITTARSLSEAKTSLKWMPVVLFVLPALLYLVGLALFAFYRQNPGWLPASTTPDAVFPHFILDEMPQGIKGLLVAGIFAATMSTASGMLSSVAAATESDFYLRFSRKDQLVPTSLWSSRVATAAWGSVGVVSAFLVPHLGTLFIASSKLYSFFLGSVLGVFLLGILTKRAVGWGAFLGFVFSMAILSALALWTRIAWTWYSAISTVLSFGIGYALSYYWSPPHGKQLHGLIYDPSVNS